tara:strand:- start:7562 stop:8632 length:1071 start_codon:yes stop_codon:yes gene_type:complete
VSKIKLNKIYIGGHNMSGKGQLLQYLNGHPNIIIFPFHKFGISYEINQFIETFSNKNKYNKKDKYTFNIIEKRIDFKKSIGLSDLLIFLFSSHNAFPALIKSHYEKLCIAYAGDEYTQKIKFNFDLKIFFVQMRKFQKDHSFKSISFEELEDIIFLSYIKSVKEFKNFNIKTDCLALFAGNGYSHYENLHKYFKNYKYIFVNRDILSRLFANIKRSYVKNKFKFDSINIYEGIIRNLNRHNQKDKKINEKYQDDKSKNNRLFLINFEELIDDNVKVLKKILSFLSLKFDKAVLKPTFIKTKVILHKNLVNENDDIKKILNVSQINTLIYLKENSIFLNFYAFFIRARKRIKASIYN